jgi:hypothetical protein
MLNIKPLIYGEGKNLPVTFKSNACGMKTQQSKTIVHIANKVNDIIKP